MEETVKKLSDIYTLYIQSSNGTFVEPDQREMKALKDGVMEVERLLLEDLEFDVEFFTPHRFALSICKLYSCPQNIAAECWEILNASYQSLICIQHPVHIIAIAGIVCAYKLLELEVSCY